MSEIPALVRFQDPLALAVHRILLRDWDPIGVTELGASGDDTEYDHYVAKIVERIRAGQTAEKLAEHLGRISGTWDCPPEQRQLELEVARKLVALEADV